MIKEKTVTIGIPAYNEELNIGQLLHSLLAQKQAGYILEKVIVVCDGCTDSTVSIVKQISKKNGRIVCIETGKRSGKTAALNILFHTSKSDVLVLCDADVKIKDKYIISKLIAPFADTHVGMTGGNYSPLPGQSTFQKALVCYELTWKEIADKINDGNNIHNSPGCLLAVKKAIYSKIIIPSDVIADDHYLYFTVQKRGDTFIFVKDARVWYQLPKNFQDFAKQTSRFLTTQMNEDVIGVETNTEYNISRSLKIKAYVQSLEKHPLLMTYALFLQFIVRLAMPMYLQHGTNPLWQQVKSSKG